MNGLIITGSAEKSGDSYQPVHDLAVRDCKVVQEYYKSIQVLAWYILFCVTSDYYNMQNMVAVEYSLYSFWPDHRTINDQKITSDSKQV